MLREIRVSFETVLPIIDLFKNKIFKFQLMLKHFLLRLYNKLYNITMAIKYLMFHKILIVNLKSISLCQQTLGQFGKNLCYSLIFTLPLSVGIVSIQLVFSLTVRVSKFKDDCQNSTVPSVHWIFDFVAIFAIKADFMALNH